MGRDSSYKKPTDTIVTIPMSPELHKRMRIRAAKEGRSLKAIGTSAIQNYLMEHEQGED